MATKKRGAPQKTCPKCNLVQHARRSLCSKCGFDFLGKKSVTVKKKATKKKAAVKATTTKKVVKRKRRRGRPAGRPAAAASGGSFSLSDISAAKALVSQLGGTAKAKSLLDVLG